MIKLYDLVFEAKQPNRKPNYVKTLGDKTEEFEEKLALMSNEGNNLLIETVNRLKGGQIEEFKSLINKYSNVKDLKGVNTPLEKKIALIKPGNTGPGEVLFHLELEDSTMVGDTTHDLIVKGKIWEVKFVTGAGESKFGKELKSDTNIKLAKKGKASQFKFNQNLLKMVFFLDRVTEVLPKLEEDFQDISPRLLSALKAWEENFSSTFTPKQAILQGSHSEKFRNAMIKIITIIKSEIEINTDNEFTTVKFGGVNVNPTEKGIDPVSITKVDDDDDSVTLNFIKDSTIKVLEILNELPYARKGDFNMDMEEAVIESLKDMPNMIVWGLDGKILVMEKSQLEDNFEFSNVTQGDLVIKIKDEVWKNA